MDITFYNFHFGYAGTWGFDKMLSMIFALGYQHFSDGAPFGDTVLAHPSVKEVYFPWIDEPSGRPILGYEEENDAEYLKSALLFDLSRLRTAGVKLDLLLNANCYGAQAMSVALAERVKGILAELDENGLLPEIVTTASPFIVKVVECNVHTHGKMCGRSHL